VQVDQPGRRELAAGIEHAQRLRGGDVGLHRLDHAEADPDVARAPQRLARIEHVGILDDQVELVVRPHGGARGCGGSGNRNDPAAARKFRRVMIDMLPPVRRQPRNPQGS